MRSLIDSSPDGADRRGHPRYSDQSPVYVGDGAVARRCRLVDVSDGGARIFIGRGAELPAHVVLVDPGTGLSHRAALVWRSESEAGFRFVEEGVRYRVMRSAEDLGWNTGLRSYRRAS
ncbi:PilZ domain-containing protein [Caulobacter sp. UNC279MFTsu5.1]|uniref:PilZ domain-containing protein n=1 Tax=Caulobacter sp. UNC279MFTsu5.1 TaxID=1502775 RepID=UPI0008EA561E|nr:PilZ domain-containing protein [Caulobacter sp. UNC279MFTsu5.1]SFJ37071.1 PilZ domain-containing protein [Caulobacter sp. UNC279MFTsu5.1]